MSAPASSPGLRHVLHALVTRALLRLHDWGLPVLVVATVTCFTLALLDRLAASEGSTGLWMAMLETATAQSNDKGVWNKLWHLLFAITVAWAGIAAYMAAVGFRLEGWFVQRLCREHLVIVAGPALSGRAQLALELAESSADRLSVVLCLPGLDAATMRRLWLAGVHVLPDNPPGSEILRLACIGRARWLVAMRDSFEDNVVLTQAALSKGGAGLACRVMVPPAEEQDVPSLEAFFSRERLHRVRAFNPSELVARHLLTRFAPDEPVARHPDRRVHVLLVGLGTVGQALLVRMAHLAHYGSGLQACVSIVDDPASPNWPRLQARVALLDRVLGVRRMAAAAAGLQPGAIRAWLQGQPPVTMVYVCTKDEVFNLRMTRLLLQVWSPRETPRIVVLDPPGGQALADLKEEFDADPDSRGRVEVFSLSTASRSTGTGAGTLAGTPLLGSLMEDLDDSLARAVHADYQQRSGSTAPGLAAWESLPEAHRASNRWAGDHFEIKLRAAGRQLAQPGSAQPAEPWGEEELDRLARMEHARWASEKALQGSRLGHEASQGDRSTLVPFAYLPRHEADKDRDQVTSLVDYLRNRAPEHERRVLVASRTQPAAAPPGDDDPGAPHLAALARRLAAELLEGLRAGLPGTVQLRVHGAGRLAGQFVALLARDLAPPVGPEGWRFTIGWVRPQGAAAPEQPAAGHPGQAPALRLETIEETTDAQGCIEASVGGLLQAAPGSRFVYLLPDPAERQPGLIDAWARALREAAQAGLDTAVPITAVCWEPAPGAPVREGYLGAATLRWVAAREAGLG